MIIMRSLSQNSYEEEKVDRKVEEVSSEFDYMLNGNWGHEHDSDYPTIATKWRGSMWLT